MARPDAENLPGSRTGLTVPARASRRVTLPLEGRDVDRGDGGPAGNIGDLVAALGPANLRLLETRPHLRPLGAGDPDGFPGEVVTLYYGTGPHKAADIEAGHTTAIGAGSDGYFGPGVYLAGDTYTALRVAESACEREGLYGCDAVHQPPIPINLFAMRASIGRVCDLKAEAGTLRAWAWRTHGIYEPEQILRLIPAFLAQHAYDTAVLRDEAGRGQDYWVIPDRSRLILTEHTVLVPQRNLIGQRSQPPGAPIRLEAILAQVPLDPTAMTGPSLTPEQVERLAHWQAERASVSARDAFRRESEQRQEVRRWLQPLVPTDPAALTRLCLWVEGLWVEPAQRTGQSPERWQGLFERLIRSDEWQTDVIGRLIELLLIKPLSYRHVNEALYWAVRQVVRRSGW